MSFQKSLLVFSGVAMTCGFGPVAHGQALEREDLAPTAPGMMNPEVEGKGVLTFSSKIQETGEILDSDTTSLSYLFKNTGSGPLTITQVKPSCGCTVPELEQKTYMPGESGKLDVTFDPKGKKGAVSQNVTVFTDSDTTRAETLIVRALVKPVIVTEPRILPFDAVNKGETMTKEFSIYGRTDDFKVTRATVDQPESFDIEVVDMGETEYQGENLRLSVIRLTIRPDARPDNHRADITVRTNDERKPIFSLAAVARVLGDLDISPVRITMGRMTVGDEFEREFKVVSKSGKAFELKSVALDTVALETEEVFEPANEEKTEWVVRITGKVVSPAPRFNTQLHLTTDVKDESELTVQMYGQLRAQ
ncbi:MAG: DUF1573 domain-containing protein [Phycisphaerales bacterium]